MGHITSAKYTYCSYIVTIAQSTGTFLYFSATTLMTLITIGI